jgi:ABC-type glycerol-3-phosphate transport system substrate-binding protein
MKLRPFELGLVVIFLLLIVGSLVLLKTYRSSDDTEIVIGPVTIWGTLPQDGMSIVLTALEQENEGYRDVRYTYIEPSEFESQLINALADNRGPDVLLLPSDQLVTLRSKLLPVSYDALPLRDIETAYIDGAKIFALADGLYARPALVDPLVLYWNKDILSQAGFIEPPKTWEALSNEYLPVLTVRNDDRTIKRSAVAFGEYTNVRNAYDTLGMLLFQAGSLGVTERSPGQYDILLNEGNDQYAQPLRTTLEFYSRFARPDNSLYSWNRSFQSDRDRFISGDLALYFGRLSEGPQLERLNPNLNFDIAEVPQGATANVRRTHGLFYGFAELRSTRNSKGARMVMNVLSSGAQSSALAQSYSVVPVQRSIVATGSNDRYGRIGYRAAGVAYGWLSPRRFATDEIFTTTLRDIVENRSSAPEATADTLERLEIEYNK